VEARKKVRDFIILRNPLSNFPLILARDKRLKGISGIFESLVLPG
tara:strand:+ start:88 stop:222 length:135 start_codon:yes stop_codon:yes gene_type:complete